MSAFFDAIPANPAIERFVDLSFDISGRIIRLLKKQGLTQRELAIKLGKKDSEVSRWLHGEHNFTLKTIAAIEIVLQENLINAEETSCAVMLDEYSDVEVPSNEDTKVSVAASWGEVNNSLTLVNVFELSYPGTTIVRERSGK